MLDFVNQVPEVSFIMNRMSDFNRIEEKLNFLAYRIESRGKLNLLDLHVHSETLYLHLLNEVFGWRLENMNVVEQNSVAFDLIDRAARIVVQVSATATKQKIQSSLNKGLSPFSGYRFLFLAVSKDASNLRNQTYVTKHNLKFDPKCDIHDIPSLLRKIGTLKASEQRSIAEYLETELRVQGGITDKEATNVSTAPAFGEITVDSNGAVLEDNENLAKLIADIVIHYSDTRQTGCIRVELDLLKACEDALESHDYGTQWHRTKLNSEKNALLEYVKRIERGLRILALAGRFRDPSDLARNARVIVRKILEYGGYVAETDEQQSVPLVVFTNRYSEVIQSLMSPSENEIIAIEMKLGFPLQGTLNNPQPLRFLPTEFLWFRAFPMMIASAAWYQAYENDDEKAAELCDYDNWLFAMD
jgi:hypothetical protein